MQSVQSIKKIASSSLFVSQPEPRYFGNSPNPTDNKHWTNANWLKSRFHFSFAEYGSGPSNFGVLRVLNDDLVQPSRGFGTHPHRNMEICTYIVDGELSHQDSMGTEEILKRGSIQFMTAGRGVYHSEHNRHPTDPLRFIQMWYVPRSSNLEPNYGSMASDCTRKEVRHNKWAHLVADVQNAGTKAPVKINQDVNIYVTELDKDAQLGFDLAPNRQAYFLCIEGSVDFGNGVKLSKYDAAEITGPLNFQITANEDSHAMVIEMKFTGDSRF